MPSPVYEGPDDPVPEEEADVLDPSTSFIDKTAAGPAIAPTAPAAPELADAEETLAGAPNAPVAPTPGTVVNPPAPPPGSPQAAGAGSFAASQEEIQAAKDKAAAGQELDENERQRLAQAKQDDENIRVQRQIEAQSQLDARNEYIAKKDAADEKVRDFKFHDYYDDPKHSSAVLDKFAVFLGGLGNLGGQNPGAANHALDTVEGKIRADHDEQLSYLNSAKYFADKQAEGVTDLLKQQQSDRAQSELEYANKKLATADKFAELAQTARGKQNYDAAMIEVAKLKKSAYDDQQKVFTDIANQNLEAARAAHQLQLANRHKGGGGGAGNGAAFTAFTDAAGALKPGDPIPANVVGLALKAGIKRDKIADQVKKYAVGANPIKPGKGGTAPGELPKDTIFYNDKPIGLAPSGRGGAAGFTKSLIAYDDSLVSLKALKKYVTENPVVGALPRGDAYNRAVLAIAATTAANPSDSTTKHEADTLKGLLRVTPAAIQTSIDHIQDRRTALLGTKRPLPKSAGVDESAPSPQASAVLEKLKSLGFQ